MSFDLVLQGGHVVDPSQGLDGIADVAFAGGKVAAVGRGLDAAGAKQVRDAKGRYVVPGLIDLHTHVYWGGTSYGVDADDQGRMGTTTSVDAGSAGAGNFLGFRKHVIDKADVRILAYVNISFPGIYALEHDVRVGEALNTTLLSIPRCVETVRAHKEVTVGVKIRVGVSTTGDLGCLPMDLAIEAADQLGMPVMAHVGQPPPMIDDIVDRLRPGDVLTHCSRPFPNAPVTASGTIRKALERGRARGVLFDVGHGAGSFGFRSAKAILQHGFLPDIISSDIHKRGLNGPAYNVLMVMSKFLCLGMPLNDVIKAATEAPAKAIHRPELGSLRPGSVGDAVMLEIEEGAFVYKDVVGEAMTGDKRFRVRGVILGGNWWHDGAPPIPAAMDKAAAF